MSDEKQIENAMAKIADVQKKELELINDDKLWAMSKDPKIVAAGAATYAATCIACHAPDMSAHIAGAKLPGLPLNDQEWKHGNNPTQLLTIIRKGAPDITKGMPPWEPQLGLQRVIEVLAFIMSKHQQGEPFTLAADSPLKAPGK
jgi:cytochrome c oxidase cbb3-type subunit 3